jgi:putative transposase
MPRKPKPSTSEAPLAPIPSEILDQFVRQGPLTPEELDSAVRRFKKAIIERALGAELSHHLGYVSGGTKPGDTTNHRNGAAARPCSRMTAHWCSPCRATVTAVLSRG